MDNPRAVITADKIMEQLVNLRNILTTRMRHPAIAPDVYNACREQVAKLDEQLIARKYAGTLVQPAVRIFTRKQRQDHKRKAGNTFTDRMNARKPEGKKMPLETRGIVGNGKFGK